MNLQQLPWIRLVASTGLQVAAFQQAGQAMARESAPGEVYFAGAAPVFASVILLLCACILLGSALRHQAARPLTSLVDYIYFGGNTTDEVPPLNLRLVTTLRRERCYARAAEECGRQIGWHSLTPELWAELVLAHRGAGDHAAEASAIESALKHLGMSADPARFAAIVKARGSLQCLPEGMPSQFER